LTGDTIDITTTRQPQRHTGCDHGLCQRPPGITAPALVLRSKGNSSTIPAVSLADPDASSARSR